MESMTHEEVKVLDVIIDIKTVRETSSWGDAQTLLNSGGILIGCATLNEPEFEDECFRYSIGFRFHESYLPPAFQ